jgi:hypothetical protein
MKKTRAKIREVKGFDHDCDWRRATVLLAQCVVATLQTDGKIGMGTGLVMKLVDGKRIVERWDKDFIKALAFIGIEMTERKKKSKLVKFTSKKSALACSITRAA